MILFISILLIFPNIQIEGLITSETIIETTSKLTYVRDILKNINEGNFFNSVQPAVNFGAPFMKSIDYFSKIILSKLEQNSNEYMNMNETFWEIIRLMNHFDPDFLKIRDTIDWNVVQVPYAKYELHLNILQTLIIEIINAPQDVRHVAVNTFIMSYDQIYQNICDELYAAFTKQKDVKTNLIEAVTHFTENRLSSVQRFFMNNIILIIKGLEVEIFYMNAKNIGGVQQNWSYNWEIKFKEILRLMEETTLGIEKNWHSQLEVDLEKFSVQNHRLSNQDYANVFYKYLVDKYQWRDWFVIVYKPITGSEKHYVYLKGGYIKFRLRGHNVLVGSKEKNSKDIDIPTVDRVLNSFTKYFQMPGFPLAQSLMEIGVLRGLGNANQDYTVAAVIIWGTDVWYLAKPEQIAYKKFEGIKTFNLIVMG